MASKKKEKPKKNNASSVLSSKNAGQPQKIIAPANPTKSGANPAKPSKQPSNSQPQSVIWRKQKETNSSRGGASGATSNDGGAGGSAEVQRFSLKISQFLKEVLAEFRKINWPERSQVARETVSVLFLVLLFTVLIWVFDLVVGKFVFAPLEHWGHMYGIGAKS